MWVRTAARDAGGPFAARAAGLVQSGLLLLVAASLLLKLHLVFLLNVNWDEFYYLALVHQYLRGELTGPFQVFHVHLFWWLPLVSDSEVSQIVAARLVMYGLGLGSCAFTYLIGRQFLNPAGALFGVLAYLSVSNILEHGTAFRADSICAFLFLAALCLLLCGPGARRAAVAGVLMALSVMVSIKVAIHLATIGSVFLIMLLPAGRRRETWMRIVAFGVTFAVAGALLYGLHRFSLPGGASVDAAQFATATADKMLLTHEFFPRRLDLLNSLIRNPVVWGLVASRLLIVAFDAARRREGALRQLLFFGAFLIPLLSVLVYENAFTYYYVFALSPAIILSGFAVDHLARTVQANGSRRALFEIAVLTGVVLAGFIIHYRENDADATVAQRQIVNAVHRMFPHPVPYLDGPSMIATFPKAGFFMSDWGIEAYRAAGRPALAQVIAEQAPVFLLANEKTLIDAVIGTQLAKPEQSLLEADRQALIENYIPHWGIVFVAGKTLKVDTSAPTGFDIAIPGLYTVEATDSVVIDGVLYAPAETVRLERGAHAMAPRAAPATVTLRWGQHLFRPTELPSREPIFVPFL